MVEEKVDRPQRAGRPRLARELYERLDEVDPRITVLLQGAWGSVANPGPADMVKVGRCAVEAILWALAAACTAERGVLAKRGAAPDDAVKAWMATTDRPATGFLHDGKLTRSAPVRYLPRERKGDVKLVEAQAVAVGRCSQGDPRPTSGRQAPGRWRPGQGP
jgi:hypothetical protein